MLVVRHESWWTLLSCCLRRSTSSDRLCHFKTLYSCRWWYLKTLGSLLCVNAIDLFICYHSNLVVLLGAFRLRVARGQKIPRDLQLINPHSSCGFTVSQSTDGMKQSHMDKFMPALQAILPEKQGPCFFLPAFKLCFEKCYYGQQLKVQPLQVYKETCQICMLHDNLKRIF